MSMLTSDDEEGLDPVDIVDFQKDLSSIVEGLESQEVEKKMWAIHKLRILFNDDVTFLVHALKSGKIVPLLDEILRREDSFDLKLEAAKAVMDSIPDRMELNDLVTDSNLVQLLLKFLHIPIEGCYEIVCEEAMKKLRSVALSPVGRDHALEHGALDTLLEILNSNKILWLRKATQTILVFSRGEPKAPFEKVKPAIRALRDLVASNVDQEVLRNACWALYYLSGATDEYFMGFCTSKTITSHPVVSQSDMISAFIEADVFPVLFKLLENPSHSVVTPAIHAVSNIFCLGDDSQKKILMKERGTDGRGVLHYLLGLLDRGKEEWMVCRCIAYITLGSRQRAKAVIDTDKLIDRVRDLAKDKKMNAAGTAISNAIIGVSDRLRMHELVECCIGPLCRDLDPLARKMDCTISLRGLKNILKYGELRKGPDGTNIYIKLIEEAGGLKNLKNMCFHRDMGLKADDLLCTYWPVYDTSSWTPER